MNLSEGVYNSSSIMAAAVAAHECGHAVQHARAYAPLTMRSRLVPVVSFASQWMSWLLLAGIVLLDSFPQLLLAGIILFAMTTLFSFVTLPVEINASKRALVCSAVPALPMPVTTHRPKTRSVRLPIRMWWPLSARWQR